MGTKKEREYMNIEILMAQAILMKIC